MDSKSPKPFLALLRYGKRQSVLFLCFFAGFSFLALQGQGARRALLLLGVKHCKTQALISQSKVSVCSLVWDFNT